MAQWSILAFSRTHTCSLTLWLASAHKAHRDNLSILHETLFLLDLLSSLINLKGTKKILHSSSITFPFEHFSIWNHEPINLKKHSEANMKGMGYSFIGLGLLVFEKININLK